MFCVPFPFPLMLPAHALQAEAPVDVRALAWMQGRWLGEHGKATFEEQWSLQGQSLLGIARTMEGDRSTFFELFALEKDGEDWVLRLRMFGPALDKALRGKEEPLRLKLVEADAKHFRCEGQDGDAGTVLVYKIAAPGRLEAHLTKTREGKVVHQEDYSFKKAR